MKWCELREGDVLYDGGSCGTTILLILTSDVLRDLSGLTSYVSEDRFVTYVSLETGRRGQMTTNQAEIPNRFIALRNGEVVL